MVSNGSLMIEIVAIFVAIFVGFHGVNGDDRCVISNTCVCIGNGYEINLSYLLQSSEIPRFKGVTSAATPNVFYSYNPCQAFKLGTDTNPGSCGNAGTAVCMTNGTENLALGTQDSAQFWFNATTGNQEIHYHTNAAFRRFIFEDMNLTPALNFGKTFLNAKFKVRQLLKCAKKITEGFTRVGLKCDQSLRLEDSRLTMDNVGITAANETTFFMTLVSPCACPNGCLNLERDDDGISFGSVLVLLFCFGVLIYLCGGIAFMFFVRGATGWELVPHYDFWMDFPLLVRDGVLFVANGCKTPTNYDRI